MERETFFTVREIADELKVNQQTVRNWIDAGALGAVRIGSRRVPIRESELERFIEAGGDVRDREATAESSADGEGQVAVARRGFDRALDAAAATAKDGEDASLVEALRQLAAAAEGLAEVIESKSGNPEEPRET